MGFENIHPRRTESLAGGGACSVRFSPQSTAAQEGRFAAAGLVAQRIRLPSSRSFQYEWRGSSHYLALHQLRRQDGESFCDGRRPSTQRDLRGTMTFVPAGDRVWGWTETDNGPQLFTALFIDPDHIKMELGQRFDVVQLRTDVYFNDSNLCGTLRKLESALGENAGQDRLYLEHLCMLSLVELCQFQELKQRGNSAGALSRAQERLVREYVEAHLDQNIGLDDLSRVTGYSRFHFLRAFKRTTGQTPYQYLLHRRIERASVALKAGEAVERVATSVGFKTPVQFVRAFRRITGTTPGRFTG